MKRILLVLLACLAVCLPAAALAEETPVAPLDASDDVLRAQLRLTALGYLTTPPTGVYDDACAAALDAYRSAAGLMRADSLPEALFAADAIAAPLPESPAAAGSTVLFGAQTPWETVRPLLVAGESYSVTSCTSGIVFHLTFSEGETYARMRPALDWDADAAADMGRGAGSLACLPVVVAIDGARAAASLRCVAPVDADDGALYEVYFTGSVSDWNGRTDAAHERALQIAAGLG